MSKTQLHRPPLQENSQLLRDLYGVRFHHVHLNNGRLVATFATEPIDADGKMVAVACAFCAAGDSPSRRMGRKIALGRLEVGKCIEMDIETLKQRISNRSLIAEFISDRIVHRFGCESVMEFIAEIRPRAPFIPKEVQLEVEEDEEVKA